MANASGVTNTTSSNTYLDRFIGYHLRKLSAAFSTHFTQAMVGTGLRQALFGILSAVDAAPGINQGEVGRILGIQRANMVALINELVDADLIDRRVARDDRRAFSLYLTTPGKAALADALNRVKSHESEMLASFSMAEQQALLDLLKRLGRDLAG